MINVNIEYPREGKQDEQMREIVLFMVKHGQIILEPVLFCLAWHEQKMRVYTLRDKDNQIEGMCIISLITDPVTGRIHKIENFKGGVDFSEQLNEILSVF